MATGTFDWASDTVGAAPAGLTAMLNTSNATWTVENDGAGGKCLRLSNSGTSDAGMSIDAIGNSTGDVELYALMRSGSTNGTQAGLATLMGTDTSTASNADTYLGAFFSGGTQIARSRRIGGDAASWGAYPSYTWTADTLYHMRLKVETSGNNAYVKVWADGESEPASWTEENTTDPLSTLTTGHAGPMARDTNGTKEWLFLGWGTGGDAAPTESAGSPLATPANFTFTAAASTRQLDGSWDTVTDAATYDWQVEEDIGGEWFLLDSGNTATLSFQLTDADGVDWSTNYRARVRAVPA